ncbi:BcsE family c-di-GMP-binding protein [Escherichia coli]
MDPVFSIGISSLWDELRHMPAGGVWWFNVDRHEDAISLANQTIASGRLKPHTSRSLAWTAIQRKSFN